LDKIQTGNA